MTTLVSSSQQAPGRRRWKWFLALGIALLFLGLASAGATTLLEVSSLLVLAPVLFASSIIQLVTAFMAEHGRERLLHCLAAGLEAVLGFVLIAHPFVVVADLVVLIAVLLMAGGLLRLARSLVTRSPGWGWALMTAGAALVLGACVWLRLPVSGLWFVGLCIALDFLCHGISWVATGLTEGRPLEESLPE
jgi:uncharacterized membrane protein HdeD (DUF308 family)